MVNCSLCGKEDLCFTCPYCNGVYCSEHRLPEGHGCPGMQRARDEARRRVVDTFSGHYEDEEYDKDVIIREGRKPRKPRKYTFSKGELRDLGIAILLVLLVGISLIGGPPIGILNAITAVPGYILLGYWWYITGMLVIFVTAFIVHELAHKFVAQHYGMYSEFRMIPQGYYLSFIAILFAVPIFGTGVVDTRGARSLEEGAKSTLAGPLSNLILSATVLALSEVIILVEGGLVVPAAILFQYGIILNAMLGLFNMIPLFPFDGYTIQRWSRPVWLVVTISLLALIIIGYFVIHLFFI
ncbi:MAG: AN1-type zinc finger domain-containing protein [Promethearchaeota archaeon]